MLHDLCVTVCICSEGSASFHIIDILFVYLLLYGLMNFNLFKGKSVAILFYKKKM